MGNTIHQQAINKDCCLIRALAICVHDILVHGGTNDTLLCEYYTTEGFLAIESKNIIHLVRKTSALLRLNKFAIDPDLLGSHSL
jgi:hypothetical protein